MGQTHQTVIKVEQFQNSQGCRDALRALGVL